MKCNIIFTNLSYPFRLLEKCFVGSIKKHMPESRLIQYSGVNTPKVDGVDEVIRKEHPFKESHNMIGLICTYFIKDVALENMIFMDMDMMLNAPIDDVFEDDFDVAICPRSKYEGMKTYLRERFPYYGIFFIKNKCTFVKDYYDLMHSFKSTHWHDDMDAKRELINSGRYKVKFLDSEIYNRLPRNKDDFDKNTKVFHFKGRKKEDRKLFAEYFYETYIK
jgi:hypothetical protein